MDDSDPLLGPLSEFVEHTRLGHDGQPGGLSPVRLPRVRDQVARFIRDPRAPLVARNPSRVPVLDLVARNLDAAELYWVTPDMSALAVAAGAQLETVRWTVADGRSRSGLIVFAGGIGMTAETDGTTLPVDAMAWGPSPAGVVIMLFCGRWRMAPDVIDFQPVRPPPLVPIGWEDLGSSDADLPVAELPGDDRTVLCALAAAWSLMGQPTITSRADAPLSRKLVRTYLRAGRPRPAVSIIDLRTLYRPSPEQSSDTGPTYRYRWVVRGHWRDQAYGPGRELRKRIFVPSYIKGPDGAPLLERERVNVWRR